MLKLSKVITTLFVTFFLIQSYAINVNVTSTSSKIEGLGFKANGSKHGGPGSTYHASSMPKGSYSFGVRMHGKDVPCLDKSGNRSVKLTNNTNAVLVVKGGRCMLKMSS